MGITSSRCFTSASAGETTGVQNRSESEAAAAAEVENREKEAWKVPPGAKMEDGEREHAVRATFVAALASGAALFAVSILEAVGKIAVVAAPPAVARLAVVERAWRAPAAVARRTPRNSISY